ncbi:hypothetical protein D6D20_05738 [Aureobasidium pullulans]|uniref:Uncharacterized protein n=1 Tax=Aureobasidium pullulans TaxID=5580 RepID=A0A4S8Z611_AURPU|nr:hypothetical protein D6D20_05738 [Aureobasidium pullulans]
MAPKKLSGSKPGRNKRKRLAAEKKENADAGMSVVTPRYPLPPKPPLPAWQQELPAVATPSVVVPSVPTTQSKFSFSSSMKTALEVKPTAIGNTKPTFDDADPVARIPGSARAISTSTGDVSASASDLGTASIFDDADPVARIPSSARAIPTSTGAVSATAYASAGAAYASAGAAYASAGAAYASAGASYASAGAASASDLGPPDDEDDDDDDDSGSSSDGSADSDNEEDEDEYSEFDYSGSEDFGEYTLSFPDTHNDMLSEDNSIEVEMLTPLTAEEQTAANLRLQTTITRAMRDITSTQRTLESALGTKSPMAAFAAIILQFSAAFDLNTDKSDLPSNEDMSAWLSDNMIELLVLFLTPGLEGDPGVKFLQPGVLSTVIPSFAAWRGSVTSAGGRIVDMNDWLTWSLRDSSWRLKILPLDSARSILALWAVKMHDDFENKCHVQ